jgi:hypothetical protein
MSIIYRGLICYNNPSCTSSFIIPEALVEQIRFEGLVNVSLKELRFQLKMKVHPHVIRPRRKVTSFPFDRAVFEVLFPQAIKFDPLLRKDKPLTYQSSVKLYEVEVTGEEMEKLIGSEWFYTHGGADVAVHVGTINLRLMERKLTEYQTVLDMESPAIIMDSITTEVAYYCRVEFAYRKITRWDRNYDNVKGVRPDTMVWKKRAQALQALNCKKVNLKRVVRKAIEILNTQ